MYYFVVDWYCCCTALFEKDVFAVGADGYSFDVYTCGDFESVEIVEEVLGQGFGFGDALQALFPSGERAELGFDFHFVEFERNLVGAVSLDFIVDAHLDFVEVVHYVGFGDEEVGNTIEHAGIAQGRDVDPAATAWTASGGAVFMSEVAKQFSCFVEKLGREGTSSDTGAVGFADTHDAANARRGYAEA